MLPNSEIWITQCCGIIPIFDTQWTLPIKI